MRRGLRTLATGSKLILLGVVFASPAIASERIDLVRQGKLPIIIHEPGATSRLAGELLARDLERLTGLRASLSTRITDCTKLCIVLGQHGSLLVSEVVKDTGVNLHALAGGWERYARTVLPSRSTRGRQYVLIAGSDQRGTVWGTVDLTRELGVSAWEWWADVAPRRVKTLQISGAQTISNEPSVRYRGMFLNDEDWGLQPWAAKTYEPETGDIGPKTYARIFELMWRLKANLIWPAMHPSTAPFYRIPGNAETAQNYAITVGTSHAEPMMRNNVREWDEAKAGSFNFFENRDAMTLYWRERVAAVKKFDNIYSVGLRGKHDSALEGALNPQMARDATADAIAVQRSMLAEEIGRKPSDIPQALTLYKEVLDIYGTGLSVPDDVTLVWPDDNYGYIKQLPNAAERQRAGGSGIYYHISYWGRPHDYLWLGTTHPALIAEQMERTYHADARRMWVVNVGDIKPAEFLTQYFLDLAFDEKQLARTPDDHLRNWLSVQFGARHAAGLTAIMREYYDLAFERRPEFMGFNSAEPITPVTASAFSAGDGSSAFSRLSRYARLVASAEQLEAKLPAELRDAYFQLVLYPVRGAASLNERILKLDLAAVRARQGRPFANALAREAAAAHDRIVTDTRAYNDLAGGKWRHIMDMAPRNLPVFERPAIPTYDFQPREGCAIDQVSDTGVAVYGFGVEADWSITSISGAAPKRSSGRLTAANGFEEQIEFHPGSTAPVSGTVTCSGRQLRFKIQSTDLSASKPVGTDRVRIIPATAYVRNSPAWEVIEAPGVTGRAMRSKFDVASKERTPRSTGLDYAFETSATNDVTLRVVGLPVHPLSSDAGVRLSVTIDGAPAQTLDFGTHGRSAEWKQNVLTNTALRDINLPQLPAGKHTVSIQALDPGVIFDRLEVIVDGAPGTTVLR